MTRIFLMLGLLAIGTAPAFAQPACPIDFQSQSASMTCRCAPDAAVAGMVWGSGPYTTDSRVCRAALHAGAIPASGGVVLVAPAAGLQGYDGSTANGVTTSDYGAWPGSFTVAAPGAVASACPADFQNQAAPITCACMADAALSGTVWGSGTYTNDSRVCRAAIHAGAIPVTGGTVTVTPAPGQQAYQGSTANGIATEDYGPWAGSFTVAAASAAPVAAAACPADFQNRSTPLSCTCTADAAMAGVVWGSGTYTTDSRICRAAVHAGVIPVTGGTVNLQPAPGLQAYAGSAANGVTTSSYGPWSASFIFQSPK
ncbi:LCCL domain-containing protein [Roseomonas sp. CAU 1739]|uniref:LCCL domain-containing protein n=1 Tax=Roseomonas sp. CAU 1739 TaxID=3140364 RepID=UPI00325BC77E